MSLYSEHQLDERLEDALEQIRKIDETKGTPDLTVESVGMLKAYINSNRHYAEGNDEQSELIVKAKRIIDRWGKTHRSEVVSDAEAKQKRNQPALRLALSKLRAEQYGELEKKEIKLLRSTLQCLMEKENKYPSDVRLEKLIKESLQKYDRLRVKTVAPNQKVELAFWQKAFVDNWYLVLGAVILCAIPIVMMTKSEPAKTTEEIVTAKWQDHLSSKDDFMKHLAARKNVQQRQSPTQKAQAVISEHQAKIEELPTGEDTPVYLNSIANLNARKLGDFGEAIRNYEILLADFPNWEGVRGVYPKLAQCYTKLGKPEEAARVYREMMNAFPEGSQENLFAREQIGL